MLVLDRPAVQRLFPVGDAIAVMREALLGHHAGTSHQPLRSVVQAPDLPGLAVVKPAAVAGTRRAFGMKIVTLFEGNAALGLDAVQGAVLLLDPSTGVPLALVEAGAVTELRTAAVSAVATDLLARSDAGDLAVLGAGVQGRAHLRSMAAVRRLRRIRLWNRTRSRADDLAAAAASWDLGVPVEVVDTPADACAGADLICTTTSSPDPVLTADMVGRGAHINAVGAFRPTTRELDTAVVVGARVFVDSVESALAEAGDLLIPGDEGVLDPKTHIVGEVGAVLAGEIGGRSSDDEVTLFESLGLAIEDIEAAAFVVDRARRTGDGREVPFP